MIDIKTLRKGDRVLIEAEFAFFDHTNPGGYFRVGGQFHEFRADISDIHSVRSQRFESGDTISVVGAGNASVKFADDKGLLVEFEDGERMAVPISCAKRLPAEDTPLNPAKEIAEDIRNAAYPIEPPAIAAE
jgi:hypothetical protein